MEGVAFHNAFLETVQESSNFSTSSQTCDFLLFSFSFFLISVLTGVKWSLIVVLICTSPSKGFYLLAEPQSILLTACVARPGG